MTYLAQPLSKPVTVSRLLEMKAAREKIVMLTCYDASFAALQARVGVEVLLVGDSLGNVLQGHSTTLPVSVVDMAYHSACVARAKTPALIVTDMPFGSYGTPEQAWHTASELMRAGAQMVKLEGGAWLADTVRMLVQRGVPVCAHLGLTPQSVHTLGGFKVQGKTASAAQILLDDARALQAAGAQLLVLEAIPATLAAHVTAQLSSMATIGIGAGVDCDGQVLVLHDLLGVFPGKAPKFVKNFMQGQSSIDAAVAAYVTAVKNLEFPAAEHCFVAN